MAGSFVLWKYHMIKLPQSHGPVEPKEMKDNINVSTVKLLPMEIQMFLGFQIFLSSKRFPSSPSHDIPPHPSPRTF